MKKHKVINEPIELENVTTDFDDLNDNNNDMISLLATNELINSKNVKRVSRIKTEQVMNITKLYLFADTFNTETPKKLADLILDLQISINGLGRKELVQLVQARVSDTPLEKSIKARDIFR